MIKLGIYRHFKGNNYEVLGTVTHSESLEELVLYRPLYGEGKLWVRPVAMWEETITREEKTFKRFEFIAEK